MEKTKATTSSPQEKPPPQRRISKFDQFVKFATDACKSPCISVKFLFISDGPLSLEIGTLSSTSNPKGGYCSLLSVFFPPSAFSLSLVTLLEVTKDCPGTGVSALFHELLRFILIYSIYLICSFILSSLSIKYALFSFSSVCYIMRRGTNTIPYRPFYEARSYPPRSLAHHFLFPPLIFSQRALGCLPSPASNSFLYIPRCLLG